MIIINTAHTISRLDVDFWLFRLRSLILLMRVDEAATLIKWKGKKEKKRMRLEPIPSPFTGSSRFHDAVRDFGRYIVILYIPIIDCRGRLLFDTSIILSSYGE